MIAYMLNAQYITILWSVIGLTSIHFDEKIKCSFAHGLDSHGNKLIQVKYERGGKTISLNPLVAFDTNFNCYGESEKMYFFNLKHEKNLYSKNIRIKTATEFRGGKKVYSKDGIVVFDSGNNYFVKNETGKILEVNDVPIEREGIVSKWQPIDINGKLIRF